MRHMSECGCRGVFPRLWLMMDGRLVLEAREESCDAFLSPAINSQEMGTTWKEMDKRNVRIKTGDLKAQG